MSLQSTHIILHEMWAQYLNSSQVFQAIVSKFLFGILNIFQYFTHQECNVSCNFDIEVFLNGFA